jgi:elongation factor Ts
MIVEGKVKKFYETTCLLEQPYIRDGDKKIKDLLVEIIAKMGENIVIRRFARFVIGE